MDIRAKFGETNFDLRSCGILRSNGKILVSVEEDGTRTLNGGAVKIGETSEDAVIREFKEETGLDVSIEGLRAVIENHFTIQEKSFQQILFVYDVTVSVATNSSLSPLNQEKILSEWIPENEVNLLQPSILNKIIQQKETTLQHFINLEQSNRIHS